jgi:hypothetical protein
MYEKSDDYDPRLWEEDVRELPAYEFAEYDLGGTDINGGSPLRSLQIDSDGSTDCIVKGE